MLGLHRRRPTPAAGATSPPARTSSSTSSQLEQIARGAARLWPSVGLTTREACGDTVRNVHGLPPRRRLPATRCSTSARGPRPPYQHFLRNPLAQRLPRKFKINFSGCATDCGQAMFNDVGVIAVTRTLDRRHRRARLPGVRRRRPRRQPAPGAGARGVHRPRGPAAHDRGDPADVRPLRQPRQQAPGPHEVARRHHGHRRAARAHLQGAQVPAAPRRTWPGGIPDDRRRSAATRRPAWPPASTPTADRPGHAGQAPARPTRTSAGRRPTSSAASPRAPCRPYAYARLGDITSDQFRALAAIQRELRRSTSGSPTARTSCFRGLTEDQLPDAATPGSPTIGMAEPGAELARDVVACPGADTCNLAVTQSRGLADAIGDALEEAGLAEVGGVRINISGCTNSLRPAPHLRHRLLRRSSAGPTAGPRPATRCCSAATSARCRSSSARRPSKLPAKTRARSGRAGRRPLRRRARAPARRSARGSTASGGAKARRRRRSKDLDDFPTPEEAPEFYVDFDETGPYVAEIGDVGVRDMSLLDPTAVAPAAGRRRSRRAGRSLAPSSSTSPRRQRSSGRGRRFGTGVGARGVVPGLRAHRRRHAGRARASRSCSSTRSTTSRRRSGTSSRCASATTSTCA